MREQGHGYYLNRAVLRDNARYRAVKSYSLTLSLHSALRLRVSGHSSLAGEAEGARAATWGVSWGTEGEGGKGKVGGGGGGGTVIT